ncbi:MAG: DUF4338 domain-containing protein [Desulfobulbaceae bacterium]|nr:DUF4338 domain-containing protein [Desulfobulbaceae bacterium]
MTISQAIAIEQCGRKFTSEDIEEIAETIKAFPNLCQTTLTETICEHLDWFTATGRYKKDACLKLLRKMEDIGAIKLPPRRPCPKQQSPKAKAAPSLPPHQSIHCNLEVVRPISIEPATTQTDVAMWNQHVDQHHYLGYKRPFGCFIRYFVRSVKGEILACILLAGAAKSISARDNWIGWNTNQRLRNLPWVINNSRFVIMPWVNIPYLASHVLAQLKRRISSDWFTLWGYRPLLMESFVDPAKYNGTCYQASNWHLVGKTTGEGLARKGKLYTTTPKLIFTMPLQKDFRSQLCREYLIGRIEI